MVGGAALGRVRVTCAEDRVAKIWRQIARSQTVRSLGALLLAYVVLLPAYGPMLDVSFAERLPYHKHVYVNGFVGGHAHSYQVDAHTQSARDVTGVEGGVVALPFGDDGAAAAITAVLLGLAVVVAVPLLLLPVSRAVVRLRRGLASYLDPPPPRSLAFAA
jgi:hypothetical protein